MIHRRIGRPGWGVDWGDAGEVPDSACCVHSDAAAADLVGSALRDGHPVPSLVLTAGDLARTLGIGIGECSEEPLRRSMSATRVVADLGSVRINDGECVSAGRQWFAAHLVARRSWWRGRLLLVANASFMGDWNVAPRAHPGDGRLHVLDAQPSAAVRWAARQRLSSGTHVPHPAITQRRVAEAQFELDPPLDVYLDGIKLVRASSLTVAVVPAALEIWIPGTTE